MREEIKRQQIKLRDLNDKKSMVENPKSDHWTKSRTAMQYQSPGRVQVHSPVSPEVENYAVNIHSS